MALLKFKRSAVPAKVPALNDIALGELAINTYDGKVYTKKDDGTPAIVEVGGTASTTSTLLMPVRNNTGATLTKGTAVYINGALGQNSTVAKAIATSDATSAQTLGIMTADLPNNTVGNVTLIGTVTNIDTSAYTDGQQLYLSPTTAGLLTPTKPYAPSHLVYMAVVEHAHPTQGKLFVKVQNGYEMDELHDVSAQNPANNDGLFYNTTSGLWEKKSIATALGYTPVNRAGDTMTGNLTVNNTVTAAILGSTSYNTPSLLRPIVGDDNWAFGGFQSAEQYWMQVQFYGVGDDNRGFRVLDKNGGTVRFRVNGAGDAYASNAFRAPIYYDSPNSAYYLDPAGTSNLSGVTLDGTLTGVTGRFAKNQTAGNYTTAALWTESYGNTTTGIAFHISGNVGKFLEMRTDGILYWQGTMNADSELRASVFRDSVNSAYFLDPDSTSVLNVVRPNIIQSSNGNTAIVLDSTTWTQFADPNGGTKLWLGGTADPNNYYNAGIHFFRNTSSGVTMTIDNAGNAIATSSFRAPIFYDTPNTAFYVDPSETSNLNFLNVSGSSVYRSDWTTRFQSPSDFVDGTLVTTDIPATGWAGDSFVIEITGKSYDQNNPPFKVVAQGYLYNDTIINYSGISYAGNFASYIKVFQDGGVLKFWWPRISYWNSFNVNVMSMDGQTNGTITRNRVTAIGNSTEPTGTKKQQINLTRTLKTGDAAGSISGFNNPTTAPTANTIVYRDGIGDIAAREIILSSGLSTVTPTVLVSMYPSTNQMVRTTPTAVAAAIQGAASGTWGINVTGNAATATNLSTGRTNWATNGTLSAVVGQLVWRNYGNGHAIFDASASLSPDGGAVNNTNAQVPWSGTYPTLMGWNGANTYGVRVDSARISDTATKATDLAYPRYTNNDFNTLGGNAPNGFRAYTNYIPSGGSYNQPPNGAGDYKVLQFGDLTEGSSIGNWGGQIVMNFYDDRMWFRRSSSTTWQAWREFIHDGNYANYAMPLGALAINTVEVRAPIFKDNINTAYYLDLNGGSRTRNIAVEAGHGDTQIRLTALAGEMGSGVQSAMTWWISEPNVSWNDGGFGFNVTNDGGTPAGFGRLNTSFGQAYTRYLNDGTMVFYCTNSSGTRYQMLRLISNNTMVVDAADIRADIYRDSGDSAFYLNPNAGSRFQTVDVNDTIYSNNWFRSYGDTGWYNQSYGGGIFMQDTTWVRVYNGKAFYVPNEIAATGNITAYYSDERLKTKTGGIDNALEKVVGLSGFLYVENDLARSLGYTNAKQQVGVSAQAVQAVLPEAVSLAPVDFETLEDGTIISKSGENYLTVDYSRLVPLLIEAIKDLSLKVKTLEEKDNSI